MRSQAAFSATAMASPKWEALEGLLGVVLEGAACDERIQTQIALVSPSFVKVWKTGATLQGGRGTWQPSRESRHNSFSRSSPKPKLFRTISSKPKLFADGAEDLR